MKIFDVSIRNEHGEFIPIRIKYDWKGKVNNPISYNIISIRDKNTGIEIHELEEKDLDRILFKINNSHIGIDKEPLETIY